MKDSLAKHSLEIIGVAIAVIIPLVAAWVERRHRKKMQQDRKLRAHFEELKREAELVISSASNFAPMARDFTIVVAVGSQAVTTSDIDEAKVSASFEAHFPERAKGLGALKQETGEHNTNCENFRQKIITDFREKGIPVEKYPRKDSCCIYEDASDALFNMWRELAQNKPPSPDFHQELNPEQADGGYFLRARGWASVIAFAKTDDEQDKCELALAEIADNMENQREVRGIVNKGNELIAEGKEFADQLASEINDIGDFWRGRKVKEFKELKRTCPRCGELF